MKTTQIIIEHLISGIQALIWLCLLFLIITPIDVSLFTLSTPFENILIALIISVVYPLGIIIDNISDEVLKPLEKSIRKNIPGGGQSMRNLLNHFKDSNLEEYFDYIRTRIRICRSTLLNFTLITINSMIFSITRWDTFSSFVNVKKHILLFAELFIGILFIIMSFYSWYILVASFYSKIAKRYEELK